MELCTKSGNVEAAEMTRTAAYDGGKVDSKKSSMLMVHMRLQFHLVRTHYYEQPEYAMNTNFVNDG